jgi:hypothetical protein
MALVTSIQAIDALQGLFFDCGTAARGKHEFTALPQSDKDSILAMFGLESELVFKKDPHTQNLQFAVD